MHNINIKHSDYCGGVDGILHFFKKCPKWSYWINWLENLSEIAIKNSPVLEECIIFGCSLNTDAIQVLNFCIIYTKYIIYIQRLFNENELDLYACLAQVKLELEIEYNICKNSKKKKKTFKNFNLCMTPYDTNT